MATGPLVSRRSGGRGLRGRFNRRLGGTIRAASGHTRGWQVKISPSRRLVVRASSSRLCVKLRSSPRITVELWPLVVFAVGLVVVRASTGVVVCSPGVVPPSGRVRGAPGVSGPPGALRRPARCVSRRAVRLYEFNLQLKRKRTFIYVGNLNT